eukprot:3940419-Rhodomonas_salina.4
MSGIAICYAAGSAVRCAYCDSIHSGTNIAYGGAGARVQRSRELGSPISLRAATRCPVLT